MSSSLLARLSLTPAQVAALPPDAARRVVQHLLRWEAFGDALASLEAMAPLVRGSAPALHAQALHGCGRTGDAYRVIEAALTHHDDATLRLTLAEIAWEAGDAVRAETQLQHAFVHLQRLSRAWWLAVRIHLARGDDAAAEQTLQQMGQVAPDSRYASLSRMALLRVRGDLVTATAHAVRALEPVRRLAPLGVAELVELRGFFAATGDQIHLHEVEERLVQLFETEQHALLATLAGDASAVAPRPAPAPLTAAPSARAAQVTVTEAERRALRDAVRHYFGFADLLPGQAEILSCVRRGEHVLAILPTGAGKSLCYQLPAFLDQGVTLVVSPLIALMKDQLDGLPPPLRSQARALNSLMDGDELRSALQRVASGQVKLLYVAPERLRQASFVEMVARAGLARLVVDEAHCVSVWGHDFRPDYLHLRQVHRDLGAPPLLAMTATAPPVVRDDIERQLLGAPGAMRVLTGAMLRANLQLRACRVRDDDERNAQLLRVLRSLQGSGIVYARSRRRCEELAGLLATQGFAAAHYHAGIENRGEVQDRFMRNELQVIVATIAFGMGIDKGDIRFIIHDGLPASLEGYYQEIGRAGRDGRLAHCLLIHADHDETTLLRLAGHSTITIERLRALYQQVRAHLGAHSSGPVPLELLQRATSDETNARVGLSLLAEAGLLQRTYDTPRTVTLQRPRRPHAEEDASFLLFAQRSGLARAPVVTAPFVALATDVGMTPTALEHALLAWQEARLLHVHYDSRDPLLTLLPPPAQVAARLEQILQNRTALERQRAGDIARYARTTQCRHGFLSSYLGGENVARCGVCDNCGAPFQLAPDPGAEGDAHVLAVLRALIEQSWGRRNLVRLLRGDAAAPVRAQQSTFYGALRARSERGVEQLIDSLQGEGLIQARDLAHGGAVLELTRRGVSAMHDLQRTQRRR